MQTGTAVSRVTRYHGRRKWREKVYNEEKLRIPTWHELWESNLAPLCPTRRLKLTRTRSMLSETKLLSLINRPNLKDQNNAKTKLIGWQSCIWINRDAEHAALKSWERMRTRIRFESRSSYTFSKGKSESLNKLKNEKQLINYRPKECFTTFTTQP